jgi:hypothetical protein
MFINYNYFVFLSTYMSFRTFKCMEIIFIILPALKNYFNDGRLQNLGIREVCL